MKTRGRFLGAASALLLIAALSTARSEAPKVAPVTEDTLTAIAQLFPAGTSLGVVEETLGLPDKIAADKSTATYFGVYYEIDRRHSPNTLVRIKRGDFYPGSATVVFSFNRKGVTETGPKVTGVETK
jgi:hypothetical protein